MVDQEISQHRAAEGSDERCHHRVSQGRAPLSQNRKFERFWALPWWKRRSRRRLASTPLYRSTGGGFAPTIRSSVSCAKSGDENSGHHQCEKFWTPPSGRGNPPPAFLTSV